MALLEKNQNFFTKSSRDLKIGMQSSYTPIKMIIPKWGGVAHHVSGLLLHSARFGINTEQFGFGHSLLFFDKLFYDVLQTDMPKVIFYDCLFLLSRLLIHLSTYVFDYKFIDYLKNATKWHQCFKLILHIILLNS